MTRTPHLHRPKNSAPDSLRHKQIAMLTAMVLAALGVAIFFLPVPTAPQTVRTVPWVGTTDFVPPTSTAADAPLPAGTTDPLSADPAARLMPYPGDEAMISPTPDDTIDRHDGQPFIDEFLSSDPIPEPGMVPQTKGALILALLVPLAYWLALRLAWLIPTVLNVVLSRVWFWISFGKTRPVSLNDRVRRLTWRVYRKWTGRTTMLLWVLSAVAMIGYLAVFFNRTVEIFGHLSVSDSRLLWPLLGIPAWLCAWHLLRCGMSFVSWKVRRRFWRSLFNRTPGPTV